MLFAAAYGLVVLVNFSALITAINMSADVVSAQVIGKLLGSAPHGAEALLGHHAYYEELLFLRATAGFPHYRQLWEAAPVAWCLIGLGLLAWSACKALGAWQGALVASAGLCAGASAREYFFSFDSHGLAAIHTVFLGVLLVWLVGRAQRLRVWQLALVAIVAGALSAAPVSSERVFLYWALLPMVGTSALLLWRTRRPEHWRVLGVAVAISAIALVGGHMIAHAMQDRHWLEVPLGVAFAPASSLLSNLVLGLTSYLFLGGGYFFGGAINFQGFTVFISGVLILCALAGLVSQIARHAQAAPGAPVAYDATQARHFAYVGFWAMCLLSTTAAYVLSTAPVDVTTSRYVLPGYIAIGALLPVLAARNRRCRAPLVAGVCLFALIASYQIVREPSATAGPPGAWPTSQQANALVRVAREEHVTYGYASYWVAADLTWLSYFKVDIYPVYRCAVPTLPYATLCRFNEQRINSWYAPTRGPTRSMLVVDPAEEMLVPGPDPGMGKPSSFHGADGLAVYVYPYDIASHINLGA